MKVSVTTLMTLSLLFACGQTKKEWNCSARGNSCEEVDKTKEPKDSSSEENTGPQGPRGPKGEEGEDGKDASPAPTPKDGSSCTVEDLSGGALITCGDGAQALILDGSPGSPAPFEVEILDPCGTETTNDEILLRVYNQVVWFFPGSNAKKSFLAVINEGSYVTTDGTSCNFTVDLNGEVNW